MGSRQSDAVVVAHDACSLAMGAYTAFLDLALGVANPALCLVASGAGLAGVYLVSTLVVLCAAGIAMQLLTRRRPR